MPKCIFILFLLLFYLQLSAQYSYDFLFETTDDEKAEFVYHDKLNDEQIVIVIVKCYWYEINCISKCNIYSINYLGDTIRWPFVDNRNDTLFSINKIYQESDGNYFMTGIGWTLDSIGQQVDVFDYNTLWNANKEMIWESIHQRPEQFNGYTGTGHFRILKLIGGNYLVGKTIITLPPLTTRYYLNEINKSTGVVEKAVVSSIVGGSLYLQSLTYSIDSSNVLLHSGRAWMNDCGRNDEGVFLLDTATYDTIRGHCYDQDDDDPYGCVNESYDAVLSGNGKLIVSGTGDCFYLENGRYLFIYEYDTAFNRTKKTFLTHPDTLYDAGWLESMDVNDFGEICLAGNQDRHMGPYSSHYSQIYLAKVDEDLNLISERYLGGDAEYVVYSMVATPDGGIVVSGSRYDYLVNTEEHDAFVIKTDGGLWVNQNEHSNIPMHSVLVYPNPGTDMLSIRTTEYPSLFKLYDAQGKLVLLKRIDNHITSVISVNAINCGFYTWMLRKESQVVDKGKWIKF